MTTYEVGQTLTFAIGITDSTGTAANVGGMTAAVYKPDGTAVAPAPTPTNPATGDYQAQTVATVAGRWRCTFTATGANSGGTPWTDVADVWPADPRFICSLADAKAELNMPSNHVVNDDELRLYIAATTPIVEEIAGRVLTATLTETFDGGRRSVLLSERPTAITTVTVDGVATTDYVVDLAAGIVYAGSSSAPDVFDFGRQNVVVTYTSGGTSVDPNVVGAARIIAAHMYSVGQQGRKRTQDEIVIASGYAVPRRALELLRDRGPYRMPGMA